MATAAANTSDKELKVLIPIDSSLHAKNAMNFYMEVMHKEKNKIIVMHIVEMPDLIHSRIPVPAKMISEKWNEECIKGQQLLDQSIEFLKNKGAKHVASRLDNSLKPGPLVVSVAAEEGINLIVIGTRGSGLIRRTVLGSVSDYVLGHVRCPIAICGLPQQEQKRRN